VVLHTNRAIGEDLAGHRIAFAKYSERSFVIEHAGQRVELQTIDEDDVLAVLGEE